MDQNKYRPILRRLAVCVAISAVAILALSEIAFLFQGDRVNRGPQQIELVIPAGSAELVSEGMSPPDIPDTLTFVIGDELVVVNQDTVDHQLGPVWVPPGGSASLQLGVAEHVAFSCSFQPTQYLGIRVEEPTTILTRLLALAIAVPPTAGILLVYSLAAFPLDSKDKPSSSPRDGNRSSGKETPYIESTSGETPPEKIG